MIECFKKIFSKVLFVVLCSVTSMSICAQESLSLSNGKINIGNYIQSYSLKPLKSYKFSN